MRSFQSPEMSMCVCGDTVVNEVYEMKFPECPIVFARPSPASPNLCLKNVTSDTAVDFIAPHGRHTVWAMYVCVETKGKYLWLPQPRIINPSSPPIPPRWHIPTVGRVPRSAWGHTSGERLLNPENQRCEYKSGTSHLCFLRKKKKGSPRGPYKSHGLNGALYCRLLVLF